MSVQAARQLNGASALLAVSVLLDSAIEHYRGSFRNRAMYTPLIVSALTIGVGAHGRGDAQPLAHRARQAVSMAAALTGIVGSGFHIYNVLKRPGRLTWQNLFYGAPVGAPIAILLAGLLGTEAEQVRRHGAAGTPARRRIGAGRVLAALSGAGLIGTAGEAGLLHFRGAFHNPAMLAPVTLPPLTGAVLLRSALAPRPPMRLAQRLLQLTALMGLAGVGFHIYGVQRNMGGWGNWRQNLLNGPPVPAPPSFTALALAGLAAIGLLRERADD